MRRKDRSPEPGSQARAAAERIEAIVEAAERAAENVIDDAEHQARQRLADAEAEAERIAEARLTSLAELIDALIGPADAVKRETESLLASLEAAKAQLESGSGQDSAPAGGERRGEGSPRLNHLAAVPPEERRLEPVSADAARPEAEPGTPAGARLLATQMAVSGSSREEIEQRLRNGFEIEDTAAILDAILGPED